MYAAMMSKGAASCNQTSNTTDATAKIILISLPCHCSDLNLRLNMGNSAFISQDSPKMAA